MIIHFSFLDLPKLHTISFNGGWVFEGNCCPENKILINGKASYDNILIMKSK